jgi:hypothetical protein
MIKGYDETSSKIFAEKVNPSANNSKNYCPPEM